MKRISEKSTHKCSAVEGAVIRHSTVPQWCRNFSSALISRNLSRSFTVMIDTPQHVPATAILTSGPQIRYYFLFCLYGSLTSCLYEPQNSLFFFFLISLLLFVRRVVTQSYVRSPEFAILHGVCICVV
jgi:hypothetical protein